MSPSVGVAGPGDGSTGSSRVAGPTPGSAGRRRWLAPIALLAGLIAVLCTVLLPVAPVSMAQPVVSWPQSASAPESTMLQLTAQTPLSLDLRFSCAAARVAGGTDDGVLFATIVPGQPSAAGQGLLVSATDGQLDVVSTGQALVTDAPLAGDCSYVVAGDAGGVTVTRDGETVGRGEAGDLPAVDVLATSVTALDPAAGEELALEMAVDDQFSTTPAPLKWVLIGLVLLGAAVCLAFLVVEDRATRRPRERVRRGLRPVDVVVPLVMVSWLFLAPMSDDDGYYAAMARNSLDEGAVGNYYQLLNQNFTPFTWFYRALGFWQQVGDSPALLRVPALVTGLLTWFLLRRFTSQPGAVPAVLQRSRAGRLSLDVMLGLATLAWWLPYGMGVRPEAMVGFLAMATLVAVASGIHRRSVLLLGLAVVAAAMSVVTHPTGFVALAPLLAGLPRIVAVVREGVRPGRALVRAVAVVAPGAVAGVAAFGDGSLNDFFRGQQIFLSIQAQNSWFDEYQRYNFLFAPIPMGSYAKRTAVVLGIACLVWFGLLAAASRRRGAVSPQLLFAAQSLALALLLLWITPSKWTHHFGALSGLGPAFLALFLVSLPVLVRALPGGLRRGSLVAVPAIGTAVLVFALSFHGPNSWAYSWMQGVPHAGPPPFVGPVRFESPVLWLAGILLLVAAVRLFGRRLGLPRRRPWLIALPLATAVFFSLSVGYLVGGFALGAVRTMDTYSPWADALRDPLGDDCGPAAAIDVLDVPAARPLQPVEGTGDEPGTFRSGEGFYPASPPPAAPGTGAATEVWGSLDGDTGGDDVGGFTSPWFTLPTDLAPDEQVAFLVTGRFDGEGNRVDVEYGRSADGEVAVVGSARADDGLRSAVWRTRTLDLAGPPAAGADVVRLVARDATVGSAGWLAFTGPSVVESVPLRDQLPEGTPVATAWQFSFLFPCQRQVDISDGITEPMTHAVLLGDGQINGLGDATWVLGRGGLFAPTLRDSSVTLIGGRFRDFPEIDTVQVFEVVAPYPAQAHDVERSTVTRWGWQGPDEAAWPYGP